MNGDLQNSMIKQYINDPDYLLIQDAANLFTYIKGDKLKTPLHVY